ELVDGIDEAIHIAAYSGGDGANELLSEIGSNLDDHPVIHQHNARIRLHQNVPRMRVRMKDTMDQKLLTIKLDEVFDHPLRVDIVPLDFMNLVDTKSLKELHDEDSRRRYFAIDLRDDDEAAVAIQLGKTLDVFGLVKKVHLFGDNA